MQRNNNITGIVWGVILVVLIVGAMIFLFPGSESEVETESERENEEEQNEEFESVSGDESNSVIVNTQLPGDVVFYSNLTLEEDGFVVVRKNDDGVPGDILGIAYHESGEGMSSNVELEGSTVEGELYYVELYADSNESGVFEEGEDEPIATSSGNNIRVRIETTEDLPEDKG